MSMSFKVQMPAVRGIQSKRVYYTIIVPFGLIPKIFYYDEEGFVPAEMRSQRDLNDKRIPDIANYILANDDWLFSSLTATVTGDVNFKPIDEKNPDIGLLEFDMHSSKFFINDGQHRRAAIKEAIKQNPELENETVSVVLFNFESIERSNQMFADLNRYAQKPTKSLNVLFDSRDPLSQATSEVLKSIDIFDKLTDKERVSLPSKSPRLFTLGSLYEANKNLLRITRKKLEEFSDHDTDILIDFWKQVISNMPTWAMVKNGDIKAWELREEYVSSHSVVIQALGLAGYYLLKEEGWKTKIEGLSGIDWRRVNTEWKGIIISGNGRVVNSRPVVKLTSTFLRKKLGLTLTDQEEKSLIEAHS